MSDQERREPRTINEVWNLKVWENHRQAPFNLKKDLFSVVWSSVDGGIIQFRLEGSGDHQIPFNRRESTSWGGDFNQANKRFEFKFKIAVGSSREMHGDFFEVDAGGPDPVASWGAEERGGGPVLGQSSSRA